MRVLWRVVNLFFLVVIANFICVFHFFDFGFISTILFDFLFIILYIFINVFPMYVRKMPFRIQVLIGGRDLLIYSFLGYLIQVVLTVYISINFYDGVGFLRLIVFNTIVAWFLLFIVKINGIIRIVSASSQLKIVWKILLFFLWWVPIFNFILIVKVCLSVRSECRGEGARQELNDVRKQSEVCATRYPILMVHGIFFRDWQLFNYWGRIPKELKRNGAKIFYGNQQSASTVADSGAELKNQILKIIETEKCEKVNIIAHSKGGLDSRYAISCLGMDEYVASITTVNTPHRGCIWVENLLKKTSSRLVDFVTKRYNTIFKKMGDKNPDFYPALCDLTPDKCYELNKIMPDKENVYYQSFTSEMSRMFSDGFPLFISYYLAIKTDNNNDGLVGVESAKWGNFLEVISTKKKRGISHGDIIDLRREDIKGFDVREYYVGLVKDLKEKGF